MKVAVVEFAGKGGLIHYAYQLCCALSETGASVELITDKHYELGRLSHPFRLTKLFRLWDSKPQRKISPKRHAFADQLRRVGRGVIYLREWLRLIRYLRSDRPDIVQFGDLRFGVEMPFLVALRRQGFSLVDICHNVRPFTLGGASSGLFRLSRADEILYRMIYRQFDYVMVHFDVNRRDFLSTFDIEPHRVIAIPHGNELIFEKLRDPSFRSDSLREELNLSRDDRVILVFGTLSRYKGIDLLLEAFAEVRRIESRARLIVVGFPLPDFDLQRILMRAEALGIGEYFGLIPHYIESDQVAAWMEIATVAVFPYRAVYQSGALHVAQSFGLPVVVTDVGAMPEVVEDGSTGLVIPPEDTKALAEAVLRLLRKPYLARRLGDKAAEEARTRFGWQEIGRRFTKHYRTILNNKTKAVDMVRNHTTDAAS